MPATAGAGCLLILCSCSEQRDKVQAGKRQDMLSTLLTSITRANLCVKRTGKLVETSHKSGILIGSNRLKERVSKVLYINPRALWPTLKQLFQKRRKIIILVCHSLPSPPPPQKRGGTYLLIAKRWAVRRISHVIVSKCESGRDTEGVARVARGHRIRLKAQHGRAIIDQS